MSTRMAGDKLKEYEAYFRNTESSPSTANYGSGGRGGELNPTFTSNQKNPIKTDIDGDYNTVTNNQDNSLRQYTIDASDNRRYYGGSNRTFNYKGGDGLSKLYDTPVSMATMGGYYDVDDSPAAQAKFFDLHTTLNSDYQKEHRKDVRTKGSGTFDHNSDVSRAINPALFYKEIRESPGRSFKMSDDRMQRMYGDVAGYKMPTYQMPEPGEPIEYGKQKELSDGSGDKDDD